MTHFKSNKNNMDWTIVDPVEELIKKEISDLENYPLTETQQLLMNYLRANIDHIVEVFDVR